MPKQWEKEMSEKKWYKLIFKQVQPIHIGFGSYGVINETRIFIPGWTMWGALTKAYNLKNRKSLSDNQELFSKISCFFPAFKKNDNFEILFPKFKDGEFHLGEYSEDKFRAKFVDTFMSTAINPLSNTALDDSLHELNVILPGAKADFCEKEEEKQLYWAGIIELDENIKIPNEIYIGGDVKYGLGKMILKASENIQDTNEEFKNFKKANYFPVNNESEEIKKVELLIEIEKAWETKDLTVKLCNGGKGFFHIPGAEISDLEGNYILKGILS